MPCYKDSYLFSSLPEKYHVELLEVVDVLGEYSEDNPEGVRLELGLLSSFRWKLAPQGFLYWAGVFEETSEGQEDD